MWGLIAGALASGIGGMMQSGAQQDAAAKAAAAAQYNPWNIQGAGGDVVGRGGNFSVSPDEQMAMFQNMFAQNAPNYMFGGGYGSQAQTFAQGYGANELESAFRNSGAMSDPTSALNAGNMFSQFSAGNALFGQQAGMDMLGRVGSYGQTGVNEGQAQRMFGLGNDALNNTDFSQLSANFIDRQRQLARPGEERAVNSKFQNLFNRGTLSATGGERQIGELALSQEMADINRVNAGEQFANMVQQQNRQFGLNAIGQGFQGRSMDQNFNMGMNQLFGNLGQGMMQFGQGAGQSAFNTQLGLNELVNTRGQQRIGNASQLLGFGAGLQNQGFNQGMGMFGGSRGINADLRSLIALSSGAGADSAMAGARQGQYMMQGGSSPFGAFLGGLGGGLMNYFSG